MIHNIEKYKQLAKMENHPLSDSEYLERSIIDMYRFNSNKNCIIKNHDSALLAASPTWAKKLGFKNIKDVLNTKDENLPCKKVAEMAETFYAQDRWVMQNKTAKHMLDVIEYDTGLAILKVVKEPIINPATGNVLGMYGSAAEFQVNTILSTVLALHSSKFGQNYSDIDVSSVNLNTTNLTELEFDILYCICLGINTTGAINKLLSCIYSKNLDNIDIDQAFNSLYEKLSCSNHLQLLEFAIANKLHLKIPRKILPFGSFDLPQQEIF